MSDNIGYYSMPAIFEDKIVFVSENDLWKVSTNGGTASRLTTSQGVISYPKFSPNGEWIAFCSTDEGSTDVYLMPSNGGPTKRLTYLGGINRVRGWSIDGEYIIFATSAKTPGISRALYLYKVHLDGGEPIEIPVGIGVHIHFNKNNLTVIGRFQDDNATWKRYRGGRAGDIIIDNSGNGEFHPLIKLDGNMVLPHFIDDKVIFLSDHEEISNIYSVSFDGSDFRKHTNHQDFFVRFLSIHEKTAVYQAGGKIFTYNFAESNPTPKSVPIYLPTIRIQRARKFINAAEFLEDFCISRTYSHLLAIVRGKAFNFGFWEEGITQLGKMHGVRYKNVIPLNNESVILTSDESGEYRLEIHSLIDQISVSIDNLEIGIPYFARVSPDSKYLAIANHRHELLLVDLEKKTLKRIARDNYLPFQRFDWSPDSKWLTYRIFVDRYISSIFLYSLVEDKEYQISPSEFQDFHPVFDPQGQHIYFISLREFNSTYDRQYFRHGFVKSSRICVINLKKDLEPPFILKPRSVKNLETTKKETNSNNMTSTKNENESVLIIDLENIQRRITMLPLKEDIYEDIQVSDDRLFFSTRPVIINEDTFPYPQEVMLILKAFKIESQEIITVVPEITNFKLGEDKKTLVIKKGKRLRVLPYTYEHKPAFSDSSQIDGDKSNQPSRKTGWIDLDRVKVLVKPPSEWNQMLKETWRLMREHYWEPTIGGINWESVYAKYSKLIEKISTREEFSDLVWEMIAETGTSHSYEMGGDYKKPPNYRQGFLGGEFEFHKESGNYIISEILKGDNWNPKISSPLDTPGNNINVGDSISAINGIKLSSDITIGEILANQANQYINLTIKSKKDGAIKTVTIKALSSESELRYRAWIRQNRALVNEKTNGKIGYIHIPDMSLKGVNEFYRSFKTEITKEGLIVDVRFNRGGNTSQLFLEMLSRKRIGYNWSRYTKNLEPYPAYTTEGPIIAVTNEFAGSDGDIFSHSFKMLKLGPLIGKRTWGGVIGIWPKIRLVDGSIVTQPEFSFWFKDVGWGVENYGTDPDIEIEYLPQDYKKGIDPQLTKGIELAKEALAKIEIEKPTSPR